ncbi:deoxyribose-phosphate aldolase [Hwanghaeella grinnelliae]|uniref:Deoxyribose-phosphate aldolase n=2 Tax=Hwanghaeella grinnelliae TaxID=2500179 RepID=A0A437QID8_9PROT|nr:deoxyribose-phosphate aldolase [Hwanghaeella grinnelliae]
MQTAARALALLDLTSLNDGDDAAAIDALCARALTPHGPVAAVCVWPRFVARAVAALKETGIRVAAVANFPDGGADIEAAVADTAAILEAGGDEVDVVFPYRSLMAGDEAIGAELVEGCKLVCGEKARLKVIIESGVLKAPELIRQASEIALNAGADFIKTSTGKVPVNATPEAAEIMLTVLKEHGQGGFKAAGGIRDTAAAGAYLAIADRIMGPGWAGPETFRFGASGVMNDLLAVLDGTGNAGGAVASGGY